MSPSLLAKLTATSAVVFGTAHSQSASCQAAADDYCASACDLTGDTSRSCDGPAVARNSGPASKGNTWRCYSPNALSHDGKSYNEHSAGNCYCSRRSDINGVLSSCEQGMVTVFAKGMDGSACYRIPSIIRTSTGILLAFSEQRVHGCGDNGENNMVLRRSTDDGATWGPMITIMKGNGRPLSNPNPVEVDLDNGRGKAILFHFDTKNNPKASNHGQNLQAWSHDGGLTWSGFHDLQHMMPLGREGCMPGPSIGVQAEDGSIYFSCHAPGDGAHLYWSRPGPSDPAYVGVSATKRSEQDTGKGMLFISETSFTQGGRVDEIQVFASRADSAFQVSAWRPTGGLHYSRVAATTVSVKKGFNKIHLAGSHSFFVAPGDVLGWYSDGVQPVVYDADASASVTVRRVYGLSQSSTSADMSGQAPGWKRAYSVQARVQSQLGDHWESSKVQSHLNECSIGMLGNGSVAMNCRTGGTRAQLAWSPDGKVLSRFNPPELRDPGCQGSMLPLAGAFYVSGDDTTNGDRSHITVKKSVDDGATWDSGRLVWKGRSGYSQLVGWESTLGLLYENGDSDTYDRISFTKWDVSGAPSVV